MAHYAKLDENNVVQEVIVFGDDIEPGVPESPLPEGWRWMQTSYNNNIRKRFAAKGMLYNQSIDAFITPQPFSSWTFNSETASWDSPIARPTDGDASDYTWNESTQSWDLIE